jgi:hypothetical protein
MEQGMNKDVLDSSRFYKILTEKGLRYIVANGDTQEAIQAAKSELRKRGLPTTNQQVETRRRAFDGYEKDTLK